MIGVGEKAPGFLLRNQNNQEVTLGSYRGHRSVLLVFYPLAFTNTCQGEFHELQSRLGDYQNAAVQVLTVSVDSIFSHKVWADREGFTFPLLSDFWPHGEVARAYGVLDERRGTAERGTFVIDRDGIVRFAECQDRARPRDQSAWREALASLGF
ncbi:peroxiredoxin [Catenuloplanes indicus]|uniref:Alkyl hydroperoxide reductase E n=1 Tax=Catenuloplanes indicus TaxID=137267 RepID=A0AAE4AXT8_9ACTN|nr:peroxiredoxin [Catenuloplanes indicus]MDQ0366076.1 peroxiredoxin (alkyl hydroperoxide reductase subunit C) [Catenuloplanes indicus]